MAVSFIGGGNRSAWRKPQTLPQITDKLYHIIQNILMSSDYKSTSDKTFSFNIQSNLSIATIEGNSEKGRIRQGVFI